MLEAKPVIANKYWILRRDNRKVGSVERDDTGFSVRINGTISHYRTIPMLRKTANIEFHPAIKTSKTKPISVHGYETGCKVHNSIWDVKRRLPLFTKVAHSKCWHAAGWFAIKQHRRWKLVRNPKLILLDRYEFRGPYMREDQVRWEP